MPKKPTPTAIGDALHRAGINPDAVRLRTIAADEIDKAA